MKHLGRAIAAAALVCSVVLAGQSPAQADELNAQSSQLSTQPTANMYRLYNPNSGEHFYTGSLYEAKSVCQAGWRWEGVGWVAPSSGNDVYRLYNPNAGDHHYTLSPHERDSLVGKGWRFEGVGWKSGGSISLMREYNPNAETGTHNFTLSSAEHANLVRAGWRDEGKAWNAVSATANPITPFAIDTGAWGEWGRFVIASDASVAHNRVISPSEGLGYWAFAKPDGMLLRNGTWSAGNDRVYIANSDYRMPTTSGWCVTDQYHDGLQRYYLEASGKGYSTARISWFDVGGATYFARLELGYVQRGWTAIGSGRHYTSYFYDNDGKLLRNATFRAGGKTWRSRQNGEVIIDHDRGVAGALIAIDIAQDPVHGYDQDGRWGEDGDYDCSSLVITCLASAGVPIDFSECSYTGNMRKYLTEHGFAWIPGTDDLRTGDILLNERTHTGYFLWGDQTVEAHCNEWGGIVGGESGDQTGREICVGTRTKYSGFDGVLRYVG